MSVELQCNALHTVTPACPVTTARRNVFLLADLSCMMHMHALCNQSGVMRVLMRSTLTGMRCRTASDQSIIVRAGQRGRERFGSFRADELVRYLVCCNMSDDW